MIERKLVNLTEIKPNDNNPRYINDDDFKALVKSLKELPEMANVREIVVNKEMVILGGNMRYRAMLEAGWQECNIVIVDWTENKQREFIIKDNVSRGDWNYDQLANEWDIDLLKDWGVYLINDYQEVINANKELDVENLLDKNNLIICPKCKFEFENV